MLTSDIEPPVSRPGLLRPSQKNSSEAVNKIIDFCVLVWRILIVWGALLVVGVAMVAEGEFNSVSFYIKVIGNIEQWNF